MNLAISSSPITLIGSGILLVLVLYFGYAFYTTIPVESDLKPVQQVTVPKIDNTKLEDQLQNLRKVDGLPLKINPDDLGKENPYK